MMVKNDSLDNLSYTVRHMRKLAGLTQNELAELAGVGKTLVFDLEAGHDGIRLENLKKILHVLNIKIVFTPPDLISDEAVKQNKKTKKMTRA